MIGNDRFIYVFVFETFLFIVGITSRYLFAVTGYCLNGLLHPCHACQSSCLSFRFFLTKLNQPFFSRLSLASNIPQITSRQSNILYFFQLDYPKCFASLVIITCGWKIPTSPPLRKIRIVMFLFSIYSVTTGRQHCHCWCS